LVQVVGEARGQVAPVAIALGGVALGHALGFVAELGAVVFRVAGRIGVVRALGHAGHRGRCRAGLGLGVAGGIGVALLADVVGLLLGGAVDRPGRALAGLTGRVARLAIGLLALGGLGVA